MLVDYTQETQLEDPVYIFKSTSYPDTICYRLVEGSHTVNILTLPDRREVDCFTFDFDKRPNQITKERAHLMVIRHDQDLD